MIKLEEGAFCCGRLRGVTSSFPSSKAAESLLVLLQRLERLLPASVLPADVVLEVVVVVVVASSSCCDGAAL